MSTGNRKVNIFLKKFLTQQQITTNFLDYLHNLILESHQKLVPNAGLYSYPVTVRSDTVDKIDLLTFGETDPGDGNGPVLSADDGHGRIMYLDNVYREDIPVPNENGTKYYVGLRFNYYPSETEINVRTGKIKWSLFQEAIGEKGEPNHVSYVDSLLQMQVDNICGDVDQVGRKIRVWLKEPQSQASGDTYEEVLIVKQNIALKHDAGNGYFDVPNGLAGYFSVGQTLNFDKTPSAPVTTTVNFIGVEDSGGTGYTRITVGADLTGYTVAANTYVLTGNNIISLAGTLGQGTAPSTTATDYDIFLLGTTVTTTDLRNNEYYAYICSYIGTGAGSNPGSFDISDQVEVPEDLGSIVNELEEFKDYQLQRNAAILRKGGQFDFNSGTLTWNEAFEIVNPFRGIYSIAAGSLGSIVTDDVLYTKIAKQQPAVLNGSASGEIWIETNTGLNPGDTVVIGDSDSTRLTGTIDSVSGTEKVTLVGAPDLSAFTTANGAWLQKTNLTLYKAQINTGDLRPDSFGKIDEDVMVIAVCDNDVLIFKNGVLRLEDGDVGQISNLPSNFNWINTLTELEESVSRSGDANVGIIAPKTYSPTAQITFNKMLSWVGLTEETQIVASHANPTVKITPDASLTASYQYIELKNLSIVNNGSGHALEIDNTGATKGIEVVLDCCVLQSSGGLSLKVTHGEAGQWIRVKWIDSKRNLNLGSVEFESQNNGDLFEIQGVRLSPANSITFGKSGTNPTSSMTIRDAMVDQVNAIGSGDLKTIDIQDSYSWETHKRIDINGQSWATFRVSQVIVDLNDFENYEKAKNNITQRGGELMTFLSGTFSWASNIELVDAFYGISFIAPSALAGLVNNDILYTKLYLPHFTVQDGNASGELKLKDTSDFNDNDYVLIGDEDSVQISGYVQGAPAVDGTITIDDGAGTPIDLSTITMANGGWIRRINLDLLKGDINTSDLRPDYLGNIDPQIYIMGVVHNGKILFKNGTIVEQIWIYEESFYVETGYSRGDAIYLPPDSRNSDAPKEYRNGAGHVEVRVNGVLLHSEQVAIESSIDPDAYASGTGVVTVPDTVDLSHVRREDYFKDAAGNEWPILGNISNEAGSKQFRIADSQTVDVSAGASIYRQGFEEYGTLHQWVNRVITKVQIDPNSIITIRVFPIDRTGGSSGGGGGGGAGSLQGAYNGGNTVAVVSGTPIVISGPAGQKLMEILGDLKVTGMIDPKGITFERNASKPWDTEEDGLWVNAAGQLNFYDKNSESNNTVGGVADFGTRQYQYTNPGSVLSGMCVTKAGAGLIQYADYNTEELSAFIGILLETLNQNDEGDVRNSGYVPSSVFSTANFVEGVKPADRSRLWLGPAGKMTITPPDKGSGLWQVIVGIWDDDGLTLQPHFLGVA